MAVAFAAKAELAFAVVLALGFCLGFELVLAASFLPAAAAGLALAPAAGLTLAFAAEFAAPEDWISLSSDASLPSSLELRRRFLSSGRSSSSLFRLGEAGSFLVFLAGREACADALAPSSSSSSSLLRFLDEDDPSLDGLAGACGGGALPFDIFPDAPNDLLALVSSPEEGGGVFCWRPGLRSGGCAADPSASFCAEDFLLGGFESGVCFEALPLAELFEILAVVPADASFLPTFEEAAFAEGSFGGKLFADPALIAAGTFGFPFGALTAFAGALSCDACAGAALAAAGAFFLRGFLKGVLDGIAEPLSSPSVSASCSVCFRCRFGRAPTLPFSSSSCSSDAGVDARVRGLAIPLRGPLFSGTFAGAFSSAGEAGGDDEAARFADALPIAGVLPEDGFLGAIVCLRAQRGSILLASQRTYCRKHKVSRSHGAVMLGMLLAMKQRRLKQTNEGRCFRHGFVQLAAAELCTSISSTTSSSLPHLDPMQFG